FRKAVISKNGVNTDKKAAAKVIPTIVFLCRSVKFSLAILFPFLRFIYLNSILSLLDFFSKGAAFFNIYKKVNQYLSLGHLLRFTYSLSFAVRFLEMCNLKTSSLPYIFRSCFSSMLFFFTNVKKAVQPMNEEINRIAPIGTADASLLPASGEETAPSNNGSMPNSALALPARRSCFAIPSINVLVIVIPIVIMYRKINNTSNANGPLKNAVNKMPAVIVK